MVYETWWKLARHYKTTITCSRSVIKALKQWVKFAQSSNKETRTMYEIWNWFKVKNKYTRIMCEICLKSAIKTQRLCVKFVQTWRQRYKNNMWNLFKVNNKYTSAMWEILSKSAIKTLLEWNLLLQNNVKSWKFSNVVPHYCSLEYVLVFHITNI